MEDRFPTKGVEITHILVVASLGRARPFYRDDGFPPGGRDDVQL
jgi:hypothetical protein